MALPKNLTGQLFGRLTACEYVKPSKWLCTCSCGNRPTVSSHNLLNGTAKSCGCFKRDVLAKVRKTHGMTNSATYVAWTNMKARCYYAKTRGFANYGGRGIKVCDRWLNSFENFLVDMGERPDGLSLDRKDSDRDYSPENCHWIDWSSQMNNQRKTIFMTKGELTLSRSQWARKLGVKSDFIRSRQRSGMTDEEALAI